MQRTDAGGAPLPSQDPDRPERSGSHDRRWCPVRLIADRGRVPNAPHAGAPGRERPLPIALIGARSSVPRQCVLANHQNDLSAANADPAKARRDCAWVCQTRSRHASCSVPRLVCSNNRPFAAVDHRPGDGFGGRSPALQGPGRWVHVLHRHPKVRRRLTCRTSARAQSAGAPCAGTIVGSRSRVMRDGAGQRLVFLPVYGAPEWLQRPIP